MSFNMLYSMLRNRHKKHLFDIHSKTQPNKDVPRPGSKSPNSVNSVNRVASPPKRKGQKIRAGRRLQRKKKRKKANGGKGFGNLFVSEFRFVILTVIIVVAALTMQDTIQDALEYYVTARFRKTPCKRFGVMFLLSLGLIMVTILIIILWKPPGNKTTEEDVTFLL